MLGHMPFDFQRLGGEEQGEVAQRTDQTCVTEHLVSTLNSEPDQSTGSKKVLDFLGVLLNCSRWTETSLTGVYVCMHYN